MSASVVFVVPAAVRLLGPLIHWFLDRLHLVLGVELPIVQISLGGLGYDTRAFRDRVSDRFLSNGT